MGRPKNGAGFQISFDKNSLPIIDMQVSFRLLEVLRSCFKSSTIFYFTSVAIQSSVSATRNEFC